MRDLRTQEEIMASWKGKPHAPIVSICCATYNHEAFIEDAIEGFLIQETDFPFEILIHDDASSDRTADIIRKYEKQYPKIIKPIYQTENQYSQRKRPMQFMQPRCNGRYIAFCEGDDFWTDPPKLQIQFDFLEKHPDYVISGHDASIIDETGQKIQDSKLPEKHQRDYSSEELMKGNGWILTLSWLYRNVINDFAPERAMVKNGDKFFSCIIGAYGKSHFHHDIEPAVYRVHPGGVWSTTSKRERLEIHANTYFFIHNYFSRIGEKDIAMAHWAICQRYVLRLTSVRVIFRELIVRVPLIKKAKKLINLSSITKKT